MGRAVALVAVFLVLIITTVPIATADGVQTLTATGYGDKPYACVYYVDESNQIFKDLNHYKMNSFLPTTVTFYAENKDECEDSQFANNGAFITQGNEIEPDTFAAQGRLYKNFLPGTVGMPLAWFVFGWDTRNVRRTFHQKPLVNVGMLPLSEPINKESFVMQNAMLCVKKTNLIFNQYTNALAENSMINKHGQDTQYNDCGKFFNTAQAKLANSPIGASKIVAGEVFKDYAGGDEAFTEGLGYGIAGAAGAVAVYLAVTLTTSVTAAGALAGVAAVFAAIPGPGWVAAAAVLAVATVIWGITSLWGGGDPSPQGWAQVDARTFELPLAAKCESYSVKIVYAYFTCLESVSGQTFSIDEQKEWGKQKSITKTCGKDGLDNFKVEIHELSEGVPKEIQVSYNEEGLTGGVAYQIWCNNPVVNPDTMQNVCEAYQYLGTWAVTDKDKNMGACCYEKTEGETVLAEGEDESRVCIKTDDGYFWESDVIEDNPTCDGGERDGLKTDNSYCCKKTMFEPYKKTEPYFCDQGEIKTPQKQSGMSISAAKKNPWSWSTSAQTWKQCTTSTISTTNGAWLCTAKNNAPLIQECACAEDARSTCGQSSTDPKWFCAPSEKGPIWTINGATPGACRESDEIKGTCCYPGRYDVEVNEQTKTEKACFNGVIVSSANGFEKTVLGKVKQP